MKSVTSGSAPPLWHAHKRTLVHSTVSCCRIVHLEPDHAPTGAMACASAGDTTAADSGVTAASDGLLRRVATDRASRTTNTGALPTRHSTVKVAAWMLSPAAADSLTTLGAQPLFKVATRACNALWRGWRERERASEASSMWNKGYDVPRAWPRRMSYWAAAPHLHVNA